MNESKVKVKRSQFGKKKKKLRISDETQEKKIPINTFIAGMGKEREEWL